jgi:subtilisin family serine protease
MNGVDPALRALVHIESIGGQVLASMESAGSASRTTAGERSVAVLLEWDGEIDRLERFGARIRSAGGGIVTADLPLSKVKQLSRLKAKYVELARPLRRELDVSLPEIRASLVHAATPANRGAGVIVGIIDSGIDFRHGAFKDVNDQTRIRSIWDQTLTPQANESSPSGFNYGVEYSMAKINQALAAANPATVVRHSDDEVGHGTHVAGIAAGDGSDPGLGKPAFTFVGVAPEAEIIFVANRSDTQEFGNSVTTLEAVRYIFARAGQLNRPCVINLSQGDNIGPHDGTSLLERGIDAELGAPGRAFVKSAGNEGASSRHAEGRVTDGGCGGPDFKRRRR